MIEKLSQKDIRALKIGAVGVAAIIVFIFASEWIDHWKSANSRLQELEEKLELIDLDKAKRAGLMTIVPEFEMPLERETQKYLFLNELNDQLRELRINSQPLQEVAGGKSPDPRYKLLRLKCSAKCRFTQVLDLLADIKENPYLVGIEEMRIKCDPQNKQQVEMELTVSTFVK